MKRMMLGSALGLLILLGSVMPTHAITPSDPTQPRVASQVPVQTVGWRRRAYYAGYGPYGYYGARPYAYGGYYRPYYGAYYRPYYGAYYRPYGAYYRPYYGAYYAPAWGGWYY